MSLSQKNLSSIQKAGQAVHGASEVIAATVRTQAQSMVASMASAPFSSESEQAIARFKTLSKLSQGLAAVETQLQELYAVASELANPASDVIVLPMVSKRRAVTNAAAVDVVAKPAKATRKAAVKKGADKAVTLTANDTKLLQYLQGVLNADAWTGLTGAEMANASGMPLGSVGLSLKKVLAAGAVKLGERGMYQLGTAAAPAAVPVAKRTSAKKAPAAPAKKVKVAKVEAPVAKEVSAKPAKKAKPASVQKPKATAAKKAKPAAAPVAPVVEVAAVEADAAPL